MCHEIYRTLVRSVQDVSKKFNSSHGLAVSHPQKCSWGSHESLGEVGHVFIDTDANHGAGRFTYMTGPFLGVSMLVNIPAPWSIWDRY